MGPDHPFCTNEKAAPKRRQKSERNVVVQVAGEAAGRGSAGAAPLLAATALG